MDIHPDIKKHVQQALDQREKDNAFGVSLIPAHAHTGADSQRVAGEDLALADSISNNVSTLKHGLMPKATGSTSTFYRSDGTQAAPVIPPPPPTPTITSFVPQSYPPAKGSAPINSNTVGTNTTALVGLFNLPAALVINSVTYRVASVATTGTYDISFYSENGQTQLGTYTTGSISGAQTFTDTITSITLAAGNIWLMINPNGTASASFYFWDYYQGPGGAGDFLVDLSGKVTFSGSLTITASTPPTTFTPSSVTKSSQCLLECRLDT